jgi:hypothetical protein
MSKKGFKTAEEARAGRARGHEKAKNFALLIGLSNDYQNDPAAKKDVIDSAGDSHSLKSGKKKWQIFLYSRTRVSTDPGFKTFNGFGKLLTALLDAFPDTYDAYVLDKKTAKDNLQVAQKKLADKLLSGTDYIEGFFSKSMFNAGEVSYLTVFGEDDDKYHVFHRDDVLKLLTKNLTVENSYARSPTQADGQKTLFKLNGKNFAELEVRNEARHYREIRFNMMAQMAYGLFKTIDDNPRKDFQGQVIVYGHAKKKFKG